MVLFAKFQKNLLFLSVLVLITSTTSCYFTQSFPIEVLQYPKSPLPKQTQSIAFVDKTCPENRDSIGFFYTLDHTKMYSEFPADSTLSESFINGLKSTLDQSGFFKINDETILNKDCNYDKKNDQLTLQHPIHADILISLEKLTINDVTTFSPDFYAGVIGKMSLSLHAKIHIYSLHSNKLIKELSFSDSITWYTNAYTAEEAYQQMPKRYDAFPEAYFWFGEMSAQDFCPYWTESHRMIYNSFFENLLQRGSESANINNWQRASYYWREAEKSKNKTMSSYASYNLAVYEEINGNIKTALEHITKAQSKRPNDANAQYHKILSTELKKIENFELLKKN